MLEAVRLDCVIDKVFSFPNSGSGFTYSAVPTPQHSLTIVTRNMLDLRSLDLEVTHDYWTEVESVGTEAYARAHFSSLALWPAPGEAFIVEEGDEDT
jgi:hypothetical protein